MKTTLIVLDLQNDTISEGGAFAGDGAAMHAVEQDVIAHVQRVIEAARSPNNPTCHSSTRRFAVNTTRSTAR